MKAIRLLVADLLHLPTESESTSVLIELSRAAKGRPADLLVQRVRNDRNPAVSLVPPSELVRIERLGRRF